MLLLKYFKENINHISKNILCGIASNKHFLLCGCYFTNPFFSPVHFTLFTIRWQRNLYIKGDKIEKICIRPSPSTIHDLQGNGTYFNMFSAYVRVILGNWFQVGQVISLCLNLSKLNFRNLQYIQSSATCIVTNTSTFLPHHSCS